MRARFGSDLRWAWLAALCVFILAGSTGALFRFGMLAGLPFGLQFGNVRHAHSHLMYFGWVTPLLTALIATRMPQATGRSLSRPFHRAIAITFVVALAAYTPFLLFGYDTVNINGSQFPPGVIGATLNMLAWYAFDYIYWVNTRGVARNRALRFWDWAILFQLLASVGAWGRGLLVAFKVTDPFVTTATVDLFLDIFSDGWFILAVLGLIFAAHPNADSPLARRAQRLIIIGLPVTFLLGVPVELVPLPLWLLSAVGGTLVAIGVLLTIAILWRAVGTAWKIPLGFLAIKSLAELGMGVPLIAARGESAGLRIPYLHVLFLGFVTLGLFAAAEEAWGRGLVRGREWMTAAVIILIATLFPLTSLMPSAWGGRWTLEAAAIGAILPPLTAIAIVWRARHYRQQESQREPAGEYAV